MAMWVCVVCTCECFTVCVCTCECMNVLLCECVPVNVWMFWIMHTKILTVVISEGEIMDNIYFTLKNNT